MSDERIEIRGYAIPFTRTRYIAAAAAVELIEPDAFAEMLRRTTAVPLLWQSHDIAAPAIGVARLHVDAYGLAFSASLNANKNLAVLAAMTRCKAPVDQCSVGLMVEDKAIGRYGTNRLHQVTRASIDHVSIVGGTAMYGDSTGVWTTHCPISEAPYRIQCMAADWEVGRAEWDARPRPRQVAAPAIPAQPRAATGSSARAPLLDQAAYAQLRVEAVRAMFSGGAGRVIGHTAWSRAAGYTGDVAALIAQARS